LKRINNEEILDTIYDLADKAGLRIDAFLEKVEEAFDEPLPDLEGVPQEVADQLYAARDDKKELRKRDRMKKSEEEGLAEIRLFREIFPQIAPADIPEEVWIEVGNGVSLPHAYALYMVKQETLDKYANDVNHRNSQSGAVVGGDGATEPIFSKEQVEKMSGKDVKSNYKNILKAMKNWKLG
jgi:hypothetical protein